MFKLLHIWAIEVDRDQQECNCEAQRSFIRDFGKSLYSSIDETTSPLSHLKLAYFTRIFNPLRDQMGAYVRLHFFTEEENFKLVETELDERLNKLKTDGKVFKISKEAIDAAKEAGKKGAKDFPDLYYNFVHHISRTAVELFNKDGINIDINTILWTWAHNFFNLLRGFQVNVVELDRSFSEIYRL